MNAEAATETRSTCPYCGVGCGVLIRSEAGRITDVRGDPDHPANRGRLCSKGSTLHLTASPTIQRELRLLRPQRRLQRGGPLQPLDWDAALDLAADRIAQTVQRDGPDAVGFYISGQLLTEDYYVFNKLAKGLLGTNNVDTNSRLCMSSAVAGYKRTLGADAPPACYDDLDHAATVFIAGSNTAAAHPVLFRRLEDARRARPDQKLIVADPRRTETAAVADLHLPLLPGTDVALFHGMLHLLLWEGLTDTAFIAAHTRDFEALREAVREFTPARAARVCGLREADLVQAARWFGGHTPTLSLYCQGLNQSHRGTDKNSALINLHLATGQIGRRGAGPLSLTGQPNAMGGREVGGLANLLSAHRDLADPVHRAEVAALWGVPDVPAAPGLSAVEMFQAAADGALKVLWIACTNPAQSMPDQALVRAALRRCEFVVLQEAFSTTATAAFADLLLPASSWGEKEGTVTNSERCVSRVRAAVPPPGEARADWRIAVDLARRLEQRLPPRRLDAASLFPYEQPEQIWVEHRASTRGRDLDIGGMSYALLERDGPQPWPLPDGQTRGRARLYEDHRFATPDGRARFAAVAFQGVAEARDARFPFSLTTGRLRDQWHGMSRTGTLGRLFGHVAEPVVQVHPQDLARLRVADGDLVSVRSRRGRLVLPVQASDSVTPTLAYIPMHWGSEVLGGRPDEQADAGVNSLLPAVFCPHSKQPELKHAAVQIAPAGLPWQLVAMAWLPAAQALRARQALGAQLTRYGYACCLPFGREPHAQDWVGVMFRAAAAEPADEAGLAELETQLGLAGTGVLRYTDRSRGQHRVVRLEGRDAGLRVRGFLLAGDVRAQAWMRGLLQDELPAADYGRALLSPGATPPVAQAPRSPQVCTCFNVTEAQIQAARPDGPAEPAAALAQVQQRLRCGTQCGSCLPALRVLLAAPPR